ncbi:MAG: hypothetical protein H8E66_17545 [Planctomycetes bacterium]|nr:hypothetical protein [Planctomycetota bacterium]
MTLERGRLLCAFSATTVLLVTVIAQGTASAHPPSGIVVDEQGNVFFLRHAAPQLIHVDPSGKLTGHRLAHDGKSPSRSHRMAGDDEGNLYVFGVGHSFWKIVDPGMESQSIVPIVYKNVPLPMASGKSLRTSSYAATPLAVDSRQALVYTQSSDFGLDGNWQIVRMDRERRAVIVAGGERGYKNGIGRAVGFRNFRNAGMAFGPDGTLYATCAGSSIRKITPDGHVSTLAGGPEVGYADGVGGDARFRWMVGLDVDKQGNVYVADAWNRRIRKVTAQGHVSTIAGNGREAHVDGAAEEASFVLPTGVAVGPHEEIYILDPADHIKRNKMRVRRLTTDGRVETFATMAYK